VVPPCDLLLFSSKFGDVENLANFLSRLSHELTGNFETSEVKERL
jgi:hypothetical protein